MLALSHRGARRPGTRAANQKSACLANLFCCGEVSVTRTSPCRQKAMRMWGSAPGTRLSWRAGRPSSALTTLPGRCRPRGAHAATRCPTGMRCYSRTELVVEGGAGSMMRRPVRLSAAMHTCALVRSSMALALLCPRVDVGYAHRQDWAVMRCGRMAVLSPSQVQCSHLNMMLLRSVVKRGAPRRAGRLLCTRWRLSLMRQPRSGAGGLQRSARPRTRAARPPTAPARRCC